MGIFTKREICIVYGDFVAREVARIINLSPGFSHRYKTCFIKSVPRPYRSHKKYPVEKITKCNLFIFQRGFLQFPGFYDQLPADCKKLSFPVVQLKSIWPLEQKDPRCKPVPSWYRIFDPSPFGDRFVMELMKKGLKYADIIETVKHVDLAELLDLDEFHYKNMAAGRDLDSRCDLFINRYIEENFQTTQLFWTPRHANGRLLLYIAGRILRALALPSLTGVQGLRVRQVSPLSSFHLPIYPQVIRHFRLEWVDKYTTYLCRHAGRLSFEQYLKRYVEFK